MRLFLIIVAAIVAATVLLGVLPFGVFGFAYGLASWFPDYCGQTHKLVQLQKGDVSFATGKDCQNVPSQDGYVLLTGEFTTVGNEPMHYIVKIRPATSHEKWRFTDFKFFTQAQWNAGK